MKVSAKVYETSNYELFLPHPLNRRVERTDDLEKSMRAYGWLDAFPAYTCAGGDGRNGQQMLIKDGNRRYQIARKIGCSVKYVVASGGPEIQELQKSTLPWTLADYLDSYSRSGRVDYLKVKHYRDETGISVMPCISLIAGECAGSANHSERFRNGTFKAGDPTHAYRVRDVVLHMQHAGIQWAVNTSLVKAISKILWLPEVDLQTLKHKISQHSYLIEKQPNVDAYLDMLERLYCRQSSAKIPLKFLAEEAARERSAAVLGPASKR